MEDTVDAIKTIRSLDPTPHIIYYFFVFFCFNGYVYAIPAASFVHPVAGG
jgi:hypothetical protein